MNKRDTFITRAIGTGKDGLKVEYIHPLAEVYGESNPIVINDERFTSTKSLTDELRKRLNEANGC